MAAVKGPKFLEMLLGLPAKGPPLHQPPRVWVQGQVGEGGLGWEPTAWPSPGLTSPPRAGKFSIRACAFTQPSFYRNTRFSPHTLHTAPPGHTSPGQAVERSQPTPSSQPLRHQTYGFPSARGVGGQEGPGSKGLGTAGVVVTPGGCASTWRPSPGLVGGALSQLWLSPFYAP